MEEEISLVDYVKVVYRQKVFIFVLILVFLVGGVLVYLARDANVYFGEAILEIGTMDICQKGSCNKFTPELVSILKSKIESRAYDNEIKNEEIGRAIKGIEVVLPEDQKDLEKVRVLRVRVKSVDADKGKEYLNKLLDAIVKSHKEQFQKKENYLKGLVERETEKIKAIEKDKNFLSLQYLYSEHLSNINDAQLSLSSIEQTEIIKRPENFAFEKKSLIIHLVTSLILGIFIGVFFAFLCDFWQRNKKEILKG